LEKQSNFYKFIVIEASNNPDKILLDYYEGKYWTINTDLIKPSVRERERIKKVVEKYRK
jgi:hypothetical protein